MKVGIPVAFQNPEAWRISDAALYRETIDFAVAVEELGIDYIWLAEHHFVDEDGYCPALMPAAAAIAARTSRIRIGTKVMLLPFHDPVRLAEDIAVVDVISGGRLDIGFAAGYRAAEFAGFGVDRRQLGQLVEENLDIILRALSGERFRHEGRHHQYGELRISPLPVQKPLPLWLGGRSRAAMRRAARHGANLALADFIEENCVADFLAYRDALGREGSDISDVEVATVSVLHVDEDSDRAWAAAEPHVLYQQNQYQQWFREAGDRTTDDFAVARSTADLRAMNLLIGTPEQVVAGIRRLHTRVPFTHLSFWSLLPGMRSEVALRSVRLFVDRVLPQIRDL